MRNHYSIQSEGKSDRRWILSGIPGEKNQAKMVPNGSWTLVDICIDQAENRCHFSSLRLLTQSWHCQSKLPCALFSAISADFFPQVTDYNLHLPPTIIQKSFLLMDQEYKFYFIGPKPNITGFINRKKYMFLYITVSVNWSLKKQRTNKI